MNRIVTATEHGRWMLAWGYAMGRLDAGNGVADSPAFASHYAALSRGCEVGVSLRESYEKWCARMAADEVAVERGIEYAQGMEERE